MSAPTGAPWRRYGSVMLLTMCSQVFSAASAVVLPLLGLATADLYSAATQVGMSGVAGVAVGIVYNLAIGRRSFDRWGAWAAASAVFVLFMATLSSVLLREQGFFGRLDGDLGLVVMAAYGVGGAALGVAGVHAVRLACVGRPRALAGVTVIPNAAVLVAVIIAASLRELTGREIYWLPAALFAASSLSLCGLALARVREQDGRGVRAQKAGETGIPAAATILVVGLIVSSVFPAVYSAAVASLDSGSLFVAALSVKLVNSGIALAVSSILLVKYNWNRAAAPLPGLTVVAAGAALAAAAVSWSIAETAPQGSTVMAVASWAAMLVAATIVSREVNARRLTRVLGIKVATDLLCAGVAAVVLTQRPSLVGFFGAFLASSAVTVCVGAWGLKERTLSIIGSAGILAAMTFIWEGWF